MKKRACQNCGSVLKTPAQQKFCSNKCQADKRYSDFKIVWLGEKEKIVTINISRHIKRYLIEATGERCSTCGWNKKHLVTKKVPLEVDHIDSDATNNAIRNLRLLCPNCHSLTHKFRNLNKGNGRPWRRSTDVK